MFGGFAGCNLARGLVRRVLGGRLRRHRCGRGGGGLVVVVVVREGVGGVGGDGNLCVEGVRLRMVNGW